MGDVLNHYEDHLADIYSWIYGDFHARLRANHDFFEMHGIVGPGNAIDLGAGPGYQSIALCDLGFSVTAADFSAKLLDELHERAGQRNIQTLQADILEDVWFGRSPSLIVCMGDTLTHLPSQDAVSSLLDSIYGELGPGGRMILTFRDLKGTPGEIRFIPVRSSEDTIFTCVLTHEVEHVIVSDLIHQKSGSGWQQKVSSYRKLKIDPTVLDQQIRARGFESLHFVSRDGLVEGIWRKPG
ncbi:MAG TPA: class I SAM-dependent methyltransferase [Leptospiraceae bacterium]|jgi:2-polyprenyl-3-methyl-5-hydroxy-6-metoxy-1,4-benzoquinol methylase|nr:class I SAM-dependent methyltransferase [Leptospirales bacterium]HMW58748.1 class I SAM-dependent methyltransferase [Leptospiraceae bacterium]HMX56020.1 class I SAM-dependent methyltransferase [Leptospiraceae bacterium]HMY47169.1 class I SAM-dependent methyltransferase [Leptospiraceae bacterium]HMZ36120.1 class I SAM-dependent methyltransferase [Leptospiraceae bacterium]